MKLLLPLIMMLAFSSCISTNFVQTELGIWEVNKGKVVPIDTLEHNELASTYWDLVESILPKEILDSFAVSLRLFTDGPDGYLAAMSSLNDSNTRWQVYIDTFDVNFRSEDSLYVLDYTHTIIHEFGHLLTLNATQIESTFDIFQDDSIGYLTNEGYAKTDSYLAKFVSEFWDGEWLQAWDEINYIPNERKRLKYLYFFYLTYADRYVTPYSAETPEEDIAESWTFFILDDKPSKKGVRYDKVRFFYQFPELVAYRDEIRSKLKSIPKDYLENYNPDGPNHTH